MLMQRRYWQQELDSALQTIKAGKNQIVVAPDKYGKSSFLLDIANSLKKPNMPIIFSAECTGLESYIRTNLISLLQAYKDVFIEYEKILSASILDIDSKLSELKISDGLRRDIKILLFHKQDKTISIDDVVNVFISLPSKIATETNTVPVILVDDADRLAGMKSQHASMSALFEYAGQSGECVFVFASHYKVADIDSVNIPLMPISYAREYISSNNVEIKEAALNAIYNFSGGVPFYINYIARLAKLSSAATAEAINLLAKDAIKNELHTYYSERLRQLSPKELPIIVCMAEHDVNTPSRISRIIDYSQTNVRRFLSIMEEKGFLTLKSRGMFEINDPVFRKWLEVQVAR